LAGCGKIEIFAWICLQEVFQFKNGMSSFKINLIDKKNVRSIFAIKFLRGGIANRIFPVGVILMRQLTISNQ
jgi:hypothetical protein